jgi:hypothetical protein
MHVSPLQQSSLPPHVCPAMRHMFVGMHVCVPASHVPEQHSDETAQVEPFMRHASGAHCAAMFCTAGLCPGSQ